ncbi:MAG: hypothetical protein H7070_16820 [Saprospiraceae bacterium]|nr:hypothetical protein [Pyrinomonadaceae bacterium]
MSAKRCEKCGESVDEAKAFCPGCGHAFVEEQKRLAASEFDRHAGTVQFGQTMYTNLLSDMGLNISVPPDSPEKQEVIIEAESSQPEKTVNVVEKKSASRKWLWIAAGVLLFLILLILATATLIFLYLSLRKS